MHKEYQLITVGALRLRRRWLVLALVVVLVLVSARLLDRAVPIMYYRVTEARTVVVGTLTGPGAWTRLSSVVETPSTVTISVSALQAPLPGTDVGYTLELVVKLQDPLGTRSVVDSSSRAQVQRTRCLPPSYFAPGCV
jgi:hypothetical protein